MTGIGIPCPFRLITGLKCPGCGVTHMCMALLCLDLSGAFAANEAVLCLLPLLGFLLIRLCRGYIRTGDLRPGRLENALAAFMVVVLLIFGIVRNL